MKSALRSYRRHIGLIVLLGLIFAAAMGYYTYHYEEDVYVSTVGLYLLPEGADVEAQYQPQVSAMLAKDVEQMLKNPESREKANEKLWPENLDGIRLTLVPVKDTHMVHLNAYGTNPDLCQKAAISMSVVLMERIQSVMDIASASIAERAEYPKQPVKPERIQKILLAFGGAFLFFSLLWLLFAPKKTRIEAEEAKWQQWGIPVLGSVTDYRKDLPFFFRRRGKKAKILLEYLNHATVEDVKALSIALRRANPESMRSIALASKLSGEGKSTLMALLASELALQGKRVLAVEMDSYAPTLGKLFGVKGRFDLLNHLSGEASLDQIILPTAVPNLFVIDHIHRKSMAMRMVSTSMFRSFLEQMREEFDFIFFDAAPLNLYSDVLALGNVLDGTLLVTAEGQITEEELQETIGTLQKMVRHVCGVVFNFARPEKLT